MESLGVDDRIVLEWILENQDGTLWTEFIWLSIVTTCGFLWTP